MSLRHPSESRLALLAGGECGPWVRFTLNRHLQGCLECEEKVAEFRDVRAALRGSAPELDWSRLSSEIHANIRLGLAAGECVREVPALRRRKWNPALALACACVALVVGASAVVVENIRLRSDVLSHSVRNEGPILQSTDQGVEVRTGSRSLMLLPHDGAKPDQTVREQGAIRALYIDGETGTVTLNTVYE